jgi:hypothetical protein
MKGKWANAVAASASSGTKNAKIGRRMRVNPLGRSADIGAGAEADAGVCWTYRAG